MLTVPYKYMFTFCLKCTQEFRFCLTENTLRVHYEGQSFDVIEGNKSCFFNNLAKYVNKLGGKKQISVLLQQVIWVG